MTEEQNKLLEQCIRYISDIRGAFTDDEQLALAKGFRDLALRECEPATEAVRDAVLEEAAKACEQVERDLHWSTKWCVQAIRALKGKGASQGEGEFVRVPREPTDAMMEAAKPAFATIDAWCAEMQLVRGRKPDWPESDPPLRQAWRLMLSAASPMSRRDEDAKR